MIKLLYFAALVDMLGTASEQLELPATLYNVRELVAVLKLRGGQWEEVFGKSSVRITVNKQFVELNSPLKDGDEVAFISAWI
jgi:molybdopterin synthase sulfur carrier subunit